MGYQTVNVSWYSTKVSAQSITWLLCYVVTIYVINMLLCCCYVVMFILLGIVITFQNVPAVNVVMAQIGAVPCLTSGDQLSCALIDNNQVRKQPLSFTDTSLLELPEIVKEL
ncbi:hypothetical protein [Pseudoalteromonas sp.]|uniref:hypothetical protein n=1 Tax=Pseudoalteromonas sp. TaxID=53249 RepID=UPI002604DEC5|nr:hypothetical protein [Pseudoalteromonas sp.]MCP4587079.1 hypothetical protein [Pseudoalteromonas sp.]